MTFTRSRAYKKNDQCHVEQKNCQVVRRFVGYDHFEGMESCRRFAQLYESIRLYVNFFQPSMKLIHKQRDGSNVTKKYDKAQTPYHRVLHSPEVPEDVKHRLTHQHEKLDPVLLLRQISEKQDQLWERAWVGADEDPCLPNAAHPPSEKMIHRNPLIDTKAIPGHSRKSNGKTDKEPPAMNKANRIYRNAKRKGRYHLVNHDWVTRPDPFRDVKEDIAQALQNRPHLEAKSLLSELQQKYPGKYKDNQLRTLQRRVKQLRMEQVRKMTEEIGIILESEPS